MKKEKYRNTLLAIKDAQSKSAVEPEGGDTLAQKLTSPLEVGAAAVTELPARVLSGIGGVASAPFVGVNKALDIQKDIYSELAWPVKSQMGQDFVQGVGSLPLVEELGQGVESYKAGTEEGANTILEYTGSPAIATAYKSIADAFPEVAELLLFKSGAAKAGQFGGIKPQPQPVPRQEPVMRDVDIDAEAESTPIQIEKAVDAVSGKDVESAIEQVQPEGRIVEASQRQSFPLTPDQYSQNAAFIEVAQATKSADPTKRAEEIESISRLEREVNKLKKDTGGYSDVAAANSALASRYNKMINKIGAREKTAYNKVRDSIENAETPYIATPNNLYELVQNKIKEVGYNNRGEPNLSGAWMDMYRKLEDNRPLDKDGRPVGHPELSYGLIEDLRKDIGSGYKKTGTFKDADSAQLDAFYSALAKDQMAGAKAYGVDADLELAHRMTQQRKAIEDNVTNFKTLMDKDGNITDMAFMDKMQKAMSSAASGNLIPFAEMIDAVPYNMREKIILSAIDPFVSSKAIKTGETTGRMADISKALNKNKQAKAKIYKHLSPERRIILDDLFTISEGIYRSANRQNASKTARDVMRQMDSKFDELIKVFGTSAEGAAMVDPSMMATTAAASTRLAQKAMNSKKSTINKATKMLNSDAFKQSMDAYLNGKKVRAQNKLIQTKEYQDWVKSLTNKADQKKLDDLGFFAWWLGTPETEIKDDNSGRVKELREKLGL
mgnify:FL=1